MCSAGEITGCAGFFPNSIKFTQPLYTPFIAYCNDFLYLQNSPSMLLLPKGFCPEGEIPRRHSSCPRRDFAQRRNSEEAP